MLLKDTVWSIKFFCEELDAFSWEVINFPIPSSPDRQVYLRKADFPSFQAEVTAPCFTVDTGLTLV